MKTIPASRRAPSITAGDASSGTPSASSTSGATSRWEPASARATGRKGVEGVEAGTGRVCANAPRASRIDRSAGDDEAAAPPWGGAAAVRQGRRPLGGIWTPPQRHEIGGNRSRREVSFAADYVQCTPGRLTVKTILTPISSPQVRTPEWGTRVACDAPRHGRSRTPARGPTMASVHSHRRGRPGQSAHRRK